MPGALLVVAMPLGTCALLGSPAQAAPSCANVVSPNQTLLGCNLSGASISAPGALFASTIGLSNLANASVSGTAALAGDRLALDDLLDAGVSGSGAGVGAALGGINLSRASLSASGALVYANLVLADLAGVSVSGPGVLVEANLSIATLAHADISGLGDLVGANLSYANLAGATLSGTGVLSGANLSYADLDGASISGLDALDFVTYANTICPDGTLSNHDGGTCVGHLDPAPVDPLGIPTPTPTPPSDTDPGPCSVNCAPVLGTSSTLYPNLDGYCLSLGDTPDIMLSGPGVVAGEAFAWGCLTASSTFVPVDMNNVCAYTTAGTIAFTSNPDNAYSWICTTPGALPSAESYSGGVYGLTGTSGMGDDTVSTFVDEAGSLYAANDAGGTVEVAPGPTPQVYEVTPSGGIEVAQAGALASGGAV